MSPAPMSSTPKASAPVSVAQPRWIPWVLYPAGDGIAQLILGEVSITRLLALALVGGLVYQAETPRWFRWLDQWRPSPAMAQQWPWRWLTQPVHPHQAQYRLNWIGRMLGSMSFFSPPWILRHMLILKLSTTPWHQIALASALPELWLAACKSFLTNLPISIVGNYIIQARLPLQYRFWGSICMSGIMGIAFALAYRFF